MNATLLKTLIAMVPVGMLFTGSFLGYLRARDLSSLLQLIGTASLLVVVLTHFCEALHLLPGMQWGLEHSTGHYLDLSSAILAGTLFPLGYLWRNVLTNRRERQHGCASLKA